jgi:predicted SnoaL-like aldol condensation-catalyzing enzyme
VSLDAQNALSATADAVEQTRLDIIVTTESIPEQNKKTVLAFYKEAQLDSDVDGAIARYVGDTYIQHTPAAEDSVEGLRAYINFFLKTFPKAKGDIRVGDGGRSLFMRTGPGS